MIVEKITLFKSNLDSGYKNVLDYSWYKPLNIENVLIDIKNIFDYKEITLSKTKSIDGNMSETLTINSNNLPNDFKEYNYLAITGRAYSEPASDKTVLFYFINSYEYVFSNEATGHTINLKLKWDSWTNNIIKFKDTIDVQALINRRHKDTFNYVESLNGGYIFTSKNLLTDEVETSTESDIQDNGKKVLFARIYLNPDADLFQVYNKPLFAESQTGGMRALYPVKVMYIPICVINEKTREIIHNYKYYKLKWTDSAEFSDQWDNFKLNYSSYNYLSPFSDEKYSQTYHKNSNDSLIETVVINDLYFITDRGYIANIDFTFHSPFSYYFVETDNESVYFDEYCSNYFSRITSTLTTPLYSLLGFGGNIKSQKIVTWTKNVNYSISMNSDILARNDTSIMSRYAIEPRLNQYPYNYYSLYSNTIEIPLIPDYDTNYFNIEMATTNITTPYIRIYRDTQPFNIKKYYISNSGSLQLTTDSLSEYLRNNTAKITEQAVMGSISSGINIFASKNNIESTKNALYGIGNITSIIAQKTDADKKADTIYIPQYLAINDTEMQDDIVTLKYEVKDDYEKEKILKYLEYYGLNVNEVGNPFIDSRLNYDFVQTSKADLSNLIKNQYEREELEKALNNGITKWHIDTCYSEAIKNFDRRYINHQNSIGLVYGILT